MKKFSCGFHIGEENLPVPGRSYKIAVAGTGYVGLSLAVLLAQHNEVTAADIVPEKVEMLNRYISSIEDEYIENYLAEAKDGRRKLNLVATLDGAAAYAEADFIIIAAPTDYDPQKYFFDCSEFSEIDSLDSRFYKASTIAEYIQWTKPDLVLLIRYTRSTGDPFFKFNNYINNNLDSYHNKKDVLKEYNASISASKNNNNYAIIPVSLQSGKTYSVSFKDINITQGKTEGISIVLFDFKKKMRVGQEIFDVEFCNRNNKDIKWTFKVPEVKTEYSLLVYAGVCGKTKNVGVDYRGINVSLLN